MSVIDRLRVRRAAAMKAQRGAAMVEMAITLSLFLLLVMGIIEFALAYHTWARINEAARDGLRYAIVSTPPVNLATMTCPGGSLEITCDATTCADLLTVTGRVAPFLQPGQVHLRYACGTVGNPARTPEQMIPEVTLEIRDVEYSFVVPSLLGLGTTLDLPAARATRTGEDLFTEVGGS